MQLRLNYMRGEYAAFGYFSQSATHTESIESIKFRGETLANKKKLPFINTQVKNLDADSYAMRQLETKCPH